jgi:NAD(P)H-dependent FMN reductase
VVRRISESILEGKPVAVVGTSPLPTGAASALADVQRILTVLGAEIVKADPTIGKVHTHIDAEGCISDPERAARISGLLVNLADYVSVKR